MVSGYEAVREHHIGVVASSRSRMSPVSSRWKPPTAWGGQRSCTAGVDAVLLPAMTSEETARTWEGRDRRRQDLGSG